MAESLNRHVAQVPRAAVEQFLDLSTSLAADAEELSYYHQDRDAGKPWLVISAEIGKAAVAMERRLKKMGAW